MSRRTFLPALRCAALPLALFLAAPGLSSSEGKADARNDQELIQGTWECVISLKDGKPLGTYVGVRATMKGDRLTWVFPQAGGATRTDKAVFSLDPAQNPKQFDWHLEDKPDVVHKRLYALEGDTLLWSTNLPGGSPRPESFAVGQWLFVMRRVAGQD